MSFPTFINTLFASGESVNTNTFAQNQTLLNSFLQNTENATIRVYVSASPGYGHQANTVNIMWSLIAAGFNQAFQVIYDDAPTVPTTIQKLATFIPGLNPAAPAPVTINGVTISFVAESAFDPATAPLINFGFTGGYDSSATNLAKTTNTTLFLKLQPYTWPQVNALYIRDAADASTITVDLSGVDVLGRFIFTRLDYYLPLPQMTDTDYDNFTTSDPTKVAPYRAILAASEGGTANMMPVYGIGDVNGTIESLTGANPESILYNLIASVASNQDNAAAPANLRRGAVIVVIATVSQDPSYNNLTALINGTNDTVPQLNTYTADTLGLADRVDIISFDDDQFATLLAGVQGDARKILVVKMNGLPSTAFNYMYYKSTLPCVYEGKGTASLVLNLPVPFFNLTSSTSNRKYVYPSIPLPNVKLIQPETAANAQAVYCNNSVAFRLKESSVTTNTKFGTGGFDATVINAASQFMRNAYTDGNATKVYLDSLSTFFHNQANDKLLQALFYMLQLSKDLN